MSGLEAEGIGEKNDNSNCTDNIDYFRSNSNDYCVFSKRASVTTSKELQSITRSCNAENADRQEMSVLW